MLQTEYQITDHFCGGNCIVSKIEQDTVYLRPDMRDTQDKWFYWAFCVKNAAGKTLTFDFEGENFIGYYGPAVSHDLEHWRWLEDREDCSKFTYTFGEEENCVYFAHHMLYHPDRFYRFAERNGLDVQVLCKSKKGRDIPYVQFGNGSRKILLSARHHSCESTGNYILEGVLTGFLQNPIENLKVFCVPFVDFDGVVDGDQGKNRYPHDHNRDYMPNEKSIYTSTEKIREYLDSEEVVYGFDFHSPWHIGGENDNVYIVQSSLAKQDNLNLFGQILEQQNTAGSMQYWHENDLAPNVRWNTLGMPTCAAYMINQDSMRVAFTLETAYFGKPDNRFTQERAVRFGIDFCEAIRTFDKKYGKKEK